MKTFHISDVLSVTTGRLVSSRHMDGVYDILNFLTGDQLWTHQLPRAAQESEPWLRAQFPKLMEDAPEMEGRFLRLDREIKHANGDGARIDKICASWVEQIRIDEGLPEYLPVYEMGADMHTRIDPIEEARAMMGDDKVLLIAPKEESEL